MIISVMTPLKNKEIQEILEQYSENGIKFTFVKKVAIKLLFEVTGTNVDNAISIAKKLIKDTEWGKVIYFNVVSD
jgi:diphthamide synthase (EF-2-diphthine--ammonia ligase)